MGLTTQKGSPGTEERGRRSQEAGPSKRSCQTRLPGSAKLCFSVRRRRAGLGRGQGREGRDPEARGGGEEGGWWIKISRRLGAKG